MDMRVDRKASFLFYLTPEFTMLAFTSALEALRLANQVLGREFYQWLLVSVDGEPVTASCGLPISAHLSLAQAKDMVNSIERPRMVVVCSGRNVQVYGARPLDNWLRACRMRGIAIGAVCTAAHHLGRAGVLRGRRCTIHWENSASFGEAFPDAKVSSQIYEVDEGIYTCAGGTASLEMMLHVVGQDHGFKIASEVCELAIVASVRDKTERQRLPFSLAHGVTNPALKQAVHAMEENQTETVLLDDLAKRIGLSRRQMERQFRNEFDCSPARFYVRLRLQRAKSLLEQTALPIIEVAIACGFVSASHFSKMYRSAFGITPHESRKPRLPDWAAADDRASA